MVVVGGGGGGRSSGGSSGRIGEREKHRVVSSRRTERSLIKRERKKANLSVAPWASLFVATAAGRTSFVVARPQVLPVAA